MNWALTQMRAHRKTRFVYLMNKVNAGYSVLENIAKTLKENELSDFNVHYNRFCETLSMVLKNVRTGGQILDVGCSPGYLTVALSKLKYQVYGIDVNPTPFKKRFEENEIIVRKCDVEKEPIPFDESKFDCVLFTEVIEHLSYYRVCYALSEMYRVLRVGGLLLLSTPNISSLENRLFLLFGKPIINITHNREYTLEETLDFLRINKFKIVKSWYSMARDIIAYVDERHVCREHVLKSFLKHRHWKNTGRALAFPLKLLIPSFRSSIFVLAKK